MEVRRRRARSAAALAGLGALIFAGTALGQCARNVQCKAGRRCVDGRCAWVQCLVDETCGKGEICDNGLCVPLVVPEPVAPTTTAPRLLPPTDPARRALLNVLVPFKGKVVRFADGIARDPADARALLQLGQVVRAELGAAEGPETVAIITAAGYDGGNNWQAVVAVWTGTGMLRSVGEFVVHDMQGSVERIAVEDGRIAVHLSRMGPDDPRCCPSVKQIARLAVVDGRLVPAPGEARIACDAQGRCAAR